MKKMKAKKTPKRRNLLAVHVHHKSSGGPMRGKNGNRKAHESKKKCRHKINF